MQTQISDTGTALGHAKLSIENWAYYVHESSALPSKNKVLMKYAMQLILDFGKAPFSGPVIDHILKNYSLKSTIHISLHC